MAGNYLKEILCKLSEKPCKNSGKKLEKFLKIL